MKIFNRSAEQLGLKKLWPTEDELVQLCIHTFYDKSKYTFIPFDDDFVIGKFKRKEVVVGSGSKYTVDDISRNQQLFSKNFEVFKISTTKFLEEQLAIVFSELADIKRKLEVRGGAEEAELVDESESKCETESNGCH